MENNFNIDELKNKIEPYRSNPDVINSKYPSSYVTYIFDKIIELFLWSKEYIESIRSEINRYVNESNETISNNLSNSIGNVNSRISSLENKQTELKNYIDSEIQKVKNSGGTDA